MAIAIAEVGQFGVHHIKLNYPAFPPPHNRETETLLHGQVAALIYAGNRTDPDIVGQTIEEVQHVLGLKINDVSSRLLVVAPDTAATTLEQSGKRVLRTEAILQCVDVDRVLEDFGFALPAEARSGSSLMAAILFQRLLQDHLNLTSSHDLLIQGKQSLRDFPLQWMSWYTKRLKPLMMQERQWHTSNEGIRYAAITLPRHGKVGEEWADIIGKKWLGSSLVLTTPNVLYLAPNATNIRAQDHILALSAAEQARDKRQPLVQIGKAYPDENVTVHSGDSRLMVTQNVFAILVDVLAARGKRLSEATAADYQEINRLLIQTGNALNYDGMGQVAPPIDILVRDGYINEDAARKLVQQEGGKHWVVPKIEEETPVEPDRLSLRELALRTGLAPNHHPDRLASLITELINRITILETTKTGQVYWGAQEGARPIYSLVRDEKLLRAYRELAELMVYNQPRDAKGKPHPFDINAIDMEPVRGKVEQELKRANLRVVVPFAGEDESIGGILKYCIGMVGNEKVIAADARKSTVSTDIARKSGAILIDEQEVLGHLDIERLKTDGVLPPNFELRGSKALTLLAGMFELEKQHQRGLALKQKLDVAEITEDEYTSAINRGEIINDDTMIIFHDSDITNPEEYNALTYLWLAKVFSPENHTPRAIHMAKTGPGRNNEPMFTAISDYMNSKDPQIRELGFALAGLIWPLAGERAMRWEDLRKCLWTNGMGIETILDLQFGIRDVETGERGLSQVANRIPKRENRPAAPDREMGMINTLQRLADALKDAMKGDNDRRTRLLTQWDVHDIAEFNRRFAGRTFQMGVGEFETDEAHPNFIQSGIVDYVLPSIQLLVNHGYLALL